MKRALAICAAVLLFGTLSASALSFSGSWSTKIDVLPDLELEYTTLSLTYTLNGFDITSVTEFDDTGFADQYFLFGGALGFVDLGAFMTFDPAVPAYKGLGLRATLDLLGIGLDLKAFHTGPGYGLNFLAYPPTYPLLGYNFGTSWAARPWGYAYAGGIPVQTDAQVVVSLKVSADPISAEVIFWDKCEGMSFYEGIFQVTDLGLCCGITFDAELWLTKVDGFKHLYLRSRNLFSFWNITFDFGITYAVDSKSVSLIASGWDFADVCINLYGDIKFGDHQFGGWTLYGIGIVCDLGDCNSLELGTAFTFYNAYTYEEEVYNVEKIEGAPAAARLPSWWRTHLLQDRLHAPPDEDTAIYWMEFEFAKITFCGPGCCGGEYKVDLAFFWGRAWDLTTATEQPDGTWTPERYGTLFGLTKLYADLSVPVMENFSVDLGIKHLIIPNDFSMSLGWTFTF